ncbi:MAG: stalk domain-containing protein [Bacillota bacterium]|nr:stalk domain-containing protein [Bacillota bacterium]
MKKRSNREAYEKRRGRIDSQPLSKESEKEDIISSQPKQEIPAAPKAPADTESASTSSERDKNTLSSTGNRQKPPVASGNPKPKPKGSKSKGKPSTAKAVAIGAVIIVLAVVLFAALYSAFGAKEPFNASFTFNSATAAVGSQTITMDNNVYVNEEEGVAMAPLEGLCEVLPITVKMEDDLSEATVKGNGVKLKLTEGEAVVTVNGEEEDWPVPPVEKDGSLYVPLVTFCKDFGYETAYAGSISRVFVFTPDDQNKAPVASLSTDKDTYEVGETVTCEADAEDPDGDEIVEWQWENHQEYFEEPGEVTISVKVMDSRGAVSEPATKTIQIVEASGSDSSEE